MSDDASRAWQFYIDDMIGFADKVIAYTNGLDQDRFIQNGLNYDATLRNLELIGEAASHVPQFVRDSHPDVPWRLMVATRNRIIHGYLGIDNDTVWSIVTGAASTPARIERFLAMSSSAFGALRPRRRVYPQPGFSTSPSFSPTASTTAAGSRTARRFPHLETRMECTPPTHTPNPPSPLTRIRPSTAVNSIDPGSASAIQKNTSPGSECSR